MKCIYKISVLILTFNFVLNAKAEVCDEEFHSFKFNSASAYTYEGDIIVCSYLWNNSWDSYELQGYKPTSGPWYRLPRRIPYFYCEGSVNECQFQKIG